MPYVVPRVRGWELRESRATDAGPRSRTLASFACLTGAVVDHAIARAERPISPREVREAARRAGAPVARSPANAAAADLLRAVAHGHRPTDAMVRLLVDALPDPAERPTAEERPMAEWIGATLEQRGAALLDLLLLADALPQRERAQRIAFPRIRTSPA